MVLVVCGTYALQEGQPKIPGGHIPPVKWGIAGISPNPSTNKVSILYSVSPNVAADLAIYDASGRSIRRIAHDPGKSSLSVAIWDGRDDNGNAMASGVYFVALKQDSRRDTRKLVILR